MLGNRASHQTSNHIACHDAPHAAVLDKAVSLPIRTMSTTLPGTTARANFSRIRKKECNAPGSSSKGRKCPMASAAPSKTCLACESSNICIKPSARRARYSTSSSHLLRDRCLDWATLKSHNPHPGGRCRSILGNIMNTFHLSLVSEDDRWPAPPPWPT